MSTKQLEIYKCEVCGIVTEVLDEGAGELVCCGQPMMLMQEKTADTGKEKHVPIIEKCDGCIKVTVGSTLHPMEEKHFIQWIEVIVDGKAYRQFLKPGDEPSACFPVTGENIIAREMCNVHGLWKG